MAQAIYYVLIAFGVGLITWVGYADIGTDLITQFETNYGLISSISLDGQSLHLDQYFAMSNIPDAFGILMTAVTWRFVMIGVQTAIGWLS